ncbi:MAG TPA: hypothetical protein VMZ01_01490 [Aestuariivirga sp.]|nr:hypothetical protein [Aestuariivirga sp.]
MNYIRTLKNKLSRLRDPWWGSPAPDGARTEPLPNCPSPLCRRGKRCRAAHQGRHCQRTHFSPPELRRWRGKSPLGKAIAAVPTIHDENDLMGRVNRITQIETLKLKHQMKIKDCWTETRKALIEPASRQAGA